ncbi:MAG: hypothetical protein JRE58_05635, partial [Deltaproteobacteria bacterium]|nr:hypothetical protein [Deltaproteobacteria bacterium]
YDRGNRQFEHPQYISQDRQNPTQRKKFTNRRNDPAELLNELLKKAAPELKTRLDEISASQKRLADAEERKAAALERIAACFQGEMPIDSAPIESVPAPETEPVSEPETKTEAGTVSEAEAELEPEVESKPENLLQEQSLAPVQDDKKTESSLDSAPASPAIIKATDVQRARVLKIVKKMHKENATYNQIALRLEEENLPTFSGRGKWHAQTIHRLLKK